MINRSFKAILYISFFLYLVVLGSGCSTLERYYSESAGEVYYTPGLTKSLNPTRTLEVTPTPPTPTISDTPTPPATEIVFEVGQELTINHLLEREITGSEITIHEQLSNGYNFKRFLVSYISEGSRIYGLLTVPFGDPPPDGFKAIIFNHGYIPPDEYQTLERYTSYVNYLARSGFVVFKIDFRGHGNSEGFASGSYFSPGYTIDAISALKSLQTLDYVNPQGIGMWGHSMAGNLVLRAMLIEPDIQAGVIWSGAVYSYEDFLEFGISDNTYRPPATPENYAENEHLVRSRTIFEFFGWPSSEEPYWQAVSLTANIDYLNSPLQIHHAEDDPVVNIGYSYGLAGALQEAGKPYELYIYEGGGHNLISPYFDQAMLRTVAFFEDNL
jgi:dipeptidyl aminopeptidase/acylaminoacyl peptidase